MPGYKLNHGFVAMVPLKMHNGWSGLRLNDDTDLKLSSKTFIGGSVPDIHLTWPIQAQLGVFFSPVCEMRALIFV